MAFGIDDALITAAAAINLTDTVARTVKSYQRRPHLDADFEGLLGEINVAALRGIDGADLALTQFERLLAESGVKIDMNLSDVIAETPVWNAIQQWRLRQFRTEFNGFADRIYSAGDDIAALARCRGEMREMGQSVVESAAAKHELNVRLLNAKSVREAIQLLRTKLVEYKEILAG
jgi:hypothetical protein